MTRWRSRSSIGEIGRELHAALPRPSRHPVKAMDAKAMELASRDAELRAALFRLVDVTPATRSLDDLARHLGAYLGEVDDRPPPIEAGDEGVAHAAPAAGRSGWPRPAACATWRTASSWASRPGRRCACCASCGTDGAATLGRPAR